MNPTDDDRPGWWPEAEKLLYTAGAGLYAAGTLIANISTWQKVAIATIMLGCFGIYVAIWATARSMPTAQMSPRWARLLAGCALYGIVASAFNTVHARHIADRRASLLTMLAGIAVFAAIVLGHWWPKRRQKIGATAGVRS